MIDLKYIQPDVAPAELEGLLDEAQRCNQQLEDGTGPGADYLGWLRLPELTPQAELTRITSLAHSLQSQSDTMVLVGVGGSYLGARAVIEALGPSLPVPHGQRAVEVLYAGHNLCGAYHAELLELLDHRRYSLVVVSKSGATLETAIAFRLLKQHLERQVGRHEAAMRTVAITDAQRGALRQLAAAKGYRTLPIGESIGGRYSVLSPVGLLPMAVAGHDIAALMEGARLAQEHTAASVPAEQNPACLYAAARNALYRKGKRVELLATFSPKLQMLGEWWRQLFAESEGKNGKGILPVCAGYTTDLHSIGQYVQQGERMLFETFLSVERSADRLSVPSDSRNFDDLNYLSNRKISEINRLAQVGTIKAHHQGRVPCINISVPELSAKNIGYLLYTMERACAISGYMLGVNPFDQPGVEAYKHNLEELLSNPNLL